MKVFVNDAPQTIDEGTNLQELLQQVSLSEKPGIAVAVNATIIAKGHWNNCALNENDKVLIITATQGG